MHETYCEHHHESHVKSVGHGARVDVEVRLNLVGLQQGD